MRISEGQWTFPSDRDGSHAICHDLPRADMEAMGMALRRANIYDFRQELMKAHLAAGGEELYEIKADGEAADAINRQIVMEASRGAHKI